MAYWLKASVLEIYVSDYPWVNYLVGHRLYQTKVILNLSNIFNFFSIRTKSLLIFFVLTLRYDQKVSGFVLRGDSPKINFHLKLVRYFVFDISTNLKDKYSDIIWGYRPTEPPKINFLMS